MRAAGKNRVVFCLLFSCPFLVSATVLTNIAVQDLNGRGGEVVEHQTTEYVEFKNNGTADVYNRKALFLFSFTNFAGRNIMDQYIQSAMFRVYAWVNHDTNNRVRLWGFTYTANNVDSKWHEGITAQNDPNWLYAYWGAYWYPSGSGVANLETQRGARADSPITFSGTNLLAYCRWGADRYPSFGFSTSNPDGLITFMLNREEIDSQQDEIHARESTEDGGIYRPYLALDVRFPEIRVGIGRSNDIPSGGEYDFGVVHETNQIAISTNLVIDNQLGEAASSLHISSLTITGQHASLFSVVATNFYLNQGQSNALSVTFNAGCSNLWGIWDQAWLVIANNDENERLFTVRLRGEIFPYLRFIGAYPQFVSNVVLAWASRTGQWFTVWTMPEALDGVWESNASVQASGRACWWTSNIAGQERRFYRAQLSP